MYLQVKCKTTNWSFSRARFTWWFQYVYECPVILLRKLFYSQGDMYFCWPITCKQLLNNLRVNMLTSVVKIQVSRLTSQTYLTIHISPWYLLVAQLLCVWLINIRKKWPKIVLFIYLWNCSLIWRVQFWSGVCYTILFIWHSLQCTNSNHLNWSESLISWSWKLFF